MIYSHQTTFQPPYFTPSDVFLSPPSSFLLVLVLIPHVISPRVEDRDDSPSLTPVPKPAPPPTNSQTRPQRNFPGSGQPPNNNSNPNQPNRPGRGGRYPSRGGPRNVYRDGGGGGGGGGRAEERGPRNTGPVPETGNLEGMENPGGFDGERVGE